MDWMKGSVQFPKNVWYFGRYSSQNIKGKIIKMGGISHSIMVNMVDCNIEVSL